VRARLTLEPGAEVNAGGESRHGRRRRASAASADAGVNRISIGVQSFDDRMLGKLGRIHNAGEARKAIDAALASFERVNVDLMYGLPGQDLAGATADLEQAIGAGAPHISAYQLTIEPNTAFFSKPAGAPGARRVRRHAGGDRRDPEGKRLLSTTRRRRSPARGSAAGTTSTTWGIRRLPRHRRRRARQDLVSRPHHRHEQAKQPNAYLKGDPIREVEIPRSSCLSNLMLNALRICAWIGSSEQYTITLNPSCTSCSPRRASPALG